MNVFNKNKIVIASRQTTLKLLEQTAEIAKEVNLSPDMRKSFNVEIANIQQSTEKLELVLSVVGIMKAGKSTLINSIVGKELLPSRNTAMTVIPTYIKHDKSIAGVNYQFKHAAAFSQLLKQLKQEGYTTSHETSLIAQRLANNNFVFNQTLCNLEQIHEELEVINDICRFCFDQTKYRDKLNNMFRNSDDFPTLFTEFKVLESVETGCDVSHFVVVDTPGANEARLPILKNIVDQQIARSSALLLVLNYTDLASEADEAMRIRIKEEASGYKDRLIVAVNRFDAKDHRSMKKSETVRYVKEELLEDIALDDDYIFPVSARNALLSSQALEFLVSHKKFELAGLQGWQRDFLDNTTGGEWDEEDEDDLEVIDNPKETLRLANKMFKSSKIGEFIDTAITRAYQNAGPDTLIASLTKLKALIEKRLICCLETDIDSSRRTVEELTQRVSRVEEGLTSLKELMFSTEQKLLSWQKSQITDTEKHIKWSLDSINIDKLEFKVVSTKEQKIWFKDLFHFFKNNPDSRSPTEKNSEDAFKKTLVKMVSAIQKAIDKKLKESSTLLAKDLQSDVDKFSNLIEKELLGDINLTPRALHIKIEFDHDAIDKDDHIEEKTEITRRERKLFGFISLSWFPDSIAYETSTETTKTFNKESYIKALIDQVKAINKDSLSIIKDKLQGVADEYQSEISQLCEIVQHSSRSAIEEKNRVSEEQTVKESYLRYQITGLDGIAENCQEIAHGLEKEKEA
ncbi:dynamin family protein [Shewanella sp. SP2S2-4]|uniref:dynamin family protein n=1 Tax=Shewanella sp. SP2S2-4 TaxID=3063539 RepID=UPI00288CBDB0|nr:dynamin family protein [Shewanella sp. SP2S2-4]MDT3275896.1 dynamin family protein [Shewanella sp. SP2S2-4]